MNGTESILSIYLLISYTATKKEFILYIPVKKCIPTFPGSPY